MNNIIAALQQIVTTSAFQSHNNNKNNKKNNNNTCLANKLKNPKNAFFLWHNFCQAKHGLKALYRLSPATQAGFFNMAQKLTLILRKINGPFLWTKEME